MLYTYTEFGNDYTYIAELPDNNFGFKGINGLSLVYHKSIPYLAVEKEYLLTNDKEVKYFFNDAEFYSMAFPNYDVIAGANTYDTPEFNSVIALLIPLNTKRGETLRVIHWFQVMHTPG